MQNSSLFVVLESTASVHSSVADKALSNVNSRSRVLACLLPLTFITKHIITLEGWQAELALLLTADPLLMVWSLAELLVWRTIWKVLWPRPALQPSCYAANFVQRWTENFDYFSRMIGFSVLLVSTLETEVDHVFQSSFVANLCKMQITMNSVKTLKYATHLFIKRKKNNILIKHQS